MVRRAGQMASLPDQMRSQMAGVLLDGLLTQLRSFPVGMRIDVWLKREFPELADLQREAIERQQKDNLQALRAEVRNFAPKQIFAANAAMNAAYAIFADRLLGNAGFAIPWRSSGLEKAGRALLAQFDRIDADPAHDRALIDSWAAELGLVGWYRWVPGVSGVGEQVSGR